MLQWCQDSVPFSCSQISAYTENSFSICLRCRVETKSSATADRCGFWSLRPSQYSMAVQVNVVCPLNMYTFLAKNHWQLAQCAQRYLLRSLNCFSSGSSDTVGSSSPVWLYWLADMKRAICLITELQTNTYQWAQLSMVLCFVCGSFWNLGLFTARAMLALQALY